MRAWFHVPKRGGFRAYQRDFLAAAEATLQEAEAVAQLSKTYADAEPLITEFDRRFLPNDLLLLSSPQAKADLERLVPFAAGLAARGGKATAFVCIDYACRLPTSDPKVFAAQLEENPAVSGRAR